jgi:hypothetical protein
MDIFRKNKILITLVIVLAVFNISTLATIWYLTIQRRPDFPEAQTHPQKIIRELLQNELKLSEDQMRAFEKSGHHNILLTRSILDSIHKNKKLIYDELFTDTPDTLKLHRYTNNIGREQAELEKCVFSHFLELKQLCNKEQQSKFKALFHDLMKLIDPARHLPVPPPPPPKNPV